MRFNSLFKQMTLLVMVLLYAAAGVQAQGTYLCNEKFSSKKPSGWDILPTHSATAPSWKPDTGICVSASYAMHGMVPYSTGDTATLVTPYFDCTSYEYVLIRFSHICKVLPSDICRIEYQEDVLGTANKWRPIPYDAYKGSAPYRQDTGFSHSSYSTWADNDTIIKPTNSWWKEETFNVSDYAGYSKVRFRFIIRKGKFLGSFIAAGWYVDDFQVIASKYELKPPVVEFLSNLTDTVYSAGPYTIKAKVASRTLAKIVNPYLAYSATYEGKTKKDSIKMTAVEGDSIWTADIPQQYYGTTVVYSIFGRDANGNNAHAKDAFINKRAKAGKPRYYTYYMASDTTGATYHNQQIVYAFNEIKSQSHTIYPGTDINPQNINLSISRIAWYIRTTETPVAVNRNLKVYLLATTNSTITAAYVDPVANKFTLVYDGTTTSQLGWNEIAFKKPFVLPAGMNLHVFVEGYGGTTSSTVSYWACHSVGTSPTTTYSINGASWVSNIYRPLMRFGIGSARTRTDSNSVALESIDNPGEGTIAGKQPVKVTIQNVGDDWLTSCQINWTVNGVLQTPVTWKGKLYTDFYDTLTLGSYLQRSMAYDTITVWVSNPNNKVDSTLDDDTLTVIAYGCDSLLKGTYTVGSGSQYNFATLSEALSIMERCNLGGDVTLKIASGTYSDNIDLSNFNPSGKYQITITSIAGNRDSVVFRPKAGPVVKLNNCAGVTFKDLTFDGKKAKPTCINLGIGLKDIEFSHCMIHGFDTAVSSNTFSTIYRASGSPIYNIRFIGNEIIGGSYGIYFYGSGTAVRNSHILFDSNHVEDYYSYATYMYYNNNLKFTHNRFDGARSGNSYDYGFLSYYNDSSLFDANRFHNKGLNSYVYGLRSYYTDSFTVISNNEIVLKNTGTTSYGMYLYYTSGTKIINNSIILNGSNSTSYGMYVYTGSTSYYADFHNNISVCLSSGTCYPNYFTSTTAASRFNVDYNCWWSKSNVGYVGAAKTTLAAFQSSLPSAVHDLYKQPVFVHSDTSALLKDHTGMNCPAVRGVNHDVDGKLRVAQTIMGAYTNELPRMNGALTEIGDFPGTTVITDTVRPYVVLMNAGLDTLREATIRVELDQVVQGRDIVWKGQLAIGETAKVALGSFMLKGGSHQLTAYLTGIGTLKDTIPADDTVKTTTFTCAGRFAGSYTVGGTGADFNTPAEAVKMINLCGVTGPVTLKVRSGSYGAVSISGTVQGASSTNSITMMPDQGAKVVIDAGAGTALHIQNSAHWHFRNLTFGNTKDGIIGVELQDQVEDVSFRHCNICASTSTTNSIYRAVSYPNSSGAGSYPVDVEFVANNIQGGYYNMYLYYLAGGTGNMQASSMTVDSNILTDAYYYGIYAYYYSHYKSMSHNTITNRKGCTNAYYGIYNYYYCNVDKPVEGNRVHVTTTGSGYGIYWYYYKNYASYGGSAGKFINNEIMVEGTGGAKYGLYFYYPYQDWEVCHNSVFAKSTSGTVYGIYAYNASSSYKLTLKNNLFVTEGTGTNYPIYAGSYYDNAYLILDYNNYVSLNNANIGYADALITSLSSWKNTTGQDMHSVNIRPDFTDSTQNFKLDDYMPFTCPRLSSVATDINGDRRTQTTTMGCYSVQIKEDVDLQAVEFLSPQPITDVTCFPASMPVRISVKNGGLKKADFSHSALKISLDVTGAISYHSDTTFTTGSMAFQQTDTFLLGTIPTLVTGLYRIKVTLNDTSDTDLSNDTMSLIYKVGRVELPYDIDFSTEPNEFINVTMAGETEWQVVKGAGSNPALTPAFGTGRLEFAGEKDKGAYAHAVFNGVNIQGCVNPTLSFWFAHNANCPGAQDMLTVLVSTDGGANYTEVKRILVADTVSAWRQYDIDLSAFTQSNCLSVVFRAMSFGNTNQSIDRIRITAKQDAALSLLPISTDNRTACDNTPVDVKAVITNLSRLNIDMLNDTLTLNVTGAVNYSNKVVYNHRLGSFESDTVTLGQIALDANGAYYFEAFMQSFDDKRENDTITDSTLFVMQDIALDTVFGLDNQMLKLVGDTISVSGVAVNNGNIAVEQVIFHMSIDGHLVVSDTVRTPMGVGDTLIHPMSRPFTVPAVSKDQPFYFFELKTELACDADNTNDVINIVGQVNIPDSIDLQVLEITTTERALGNTKLSPSVRVANIGNLEADNIVVHVEVVNDSNRVVENISEMISHMAVNETKMHDFTMTYKVPNYTGKYTLRAYVEAFDGDSIRSNDTIAKQFRCYRDSVGIREVTGLDWSLGQNIPNPATEITIIPFTLPQEGTVRLSVMTANGQVIHRQEIQGEAGGNRFELNTADWASGIYYYTMEYRGQRITRKMNIAR